MQRKPKILARQEYPLSVLLGLNTLATILPFLLLGIYGLSQYVAAERAEQLDRLARYTETFTSAVDRELKGYIHTTEVLAASSLLAEGDMNAFTSLMRDAANKTNGNFVLIDRLGREHFSTRRPADAELPETGDTNSLDEVFRRRTPVVSNLFNGAIARELVFVVRVPVELAGKVRYVLSFTPSANAIDGIIQQNQLPEGWRAAVYDGDGRNIARSFRQEEFHGKVSVPEILERLGQSRGVAEMTDFEGRPVVFAHQRSGPSDWHVAVWVPQSLLNAATDQVIGLVIGLATLTLLVSFASAYLAARTISGPARQILKAAQALGTGEPVRFKATHMREGNVVGSALAEAAKDIAAREQTLRESELHTRFIMRELAHRSKNLLAVVQAMARQTGRTARDVKEFNGQLGERLAGLGRSQDLLVQKNWRGVSLEDLAATQLKPFVDHEWRLNTSGPPVLLSSDAAQNVGMALHELATNASKHGALSIPSGSISITWEWCANADGGRRLQLRWQETGGPPVSRPTRKGFGHAVIERLTSASLRGTAKFDWRPEGLVWTLDAPESALAGGSDEPQDELQEASTAHMLSSRPAATDSLCRS